MWLKFPSLVILEIRVGPDPHLRFLVTDKFLFPQSPIGRPIGKMRGDTMTIYVRFNHEITKSTVGSKFYTSIGNKQIINSLKIILK